MFDEKVSVLIPYKSDDAYRQRNWEWLKRRYELLMPDAELCIGEVDIKPYCKAAAVNSAARKATRDIYIIADADIAFDVGNMKNAISLLDSHAWVIPYEDRKELNESQTAALIKNSSPSATLSDIDFTGCGNYASGVGSVNIVPRKFFEGAGGFDERFKGWGYEDNAFAMALDTLFGSHIRPKGGLIWHLNHPPSVVHPKKNCDLFHCEYGSLDAFLASERYKSLHFNNLEH